MTRERDIWVGRCDRCATVQVREVGSVLVCGWGPWTHDENGDMCVGVVQPIAVEHQPQLQATYRLCGYAATLALLAAMER